MISVLAKRIAMGDFMDTVLLDKTTTTSIKGIAILLVIIAHVGHGGFGVRLFVPLGCFGVSVFLILSGYGLMESYRRSGLDSFWRKRMIRILLPYLLWICAYSIYLFVSHAPISLNDIRYWFVEFIIIWYFAFYCSLRFCPKHKYLILFVFALSLFLFQNNLQAQQSISFIIGVLISDYKDRIMTIKPRKMLIIGCLCLSFGLLAFCLRQWIIITDSGIPVTGIKDLLVSKTIEKSDILGKLIQIITKVPVALFIIIIMHKIHIGDRKLSYKIGLISYELYLVHFPLYSSISNNIVYLVLFVIETIIMSYLLYRANNAIIKIWK